MENIDPDKIITKTDMLLYLILQELQRINPPVCPTREGIEADEPKPHICTCKRCGAKIEGHGAFLKHARACKREGRLNAL
jgi:hypothetical protein